MVPLILIGFPKALSPWLQSHLFGGDYGFKMAMNPGACAKYLTFPRDFAWSASAAQNFYNAQLEALSTQGSQFIPVVSNENLCGSLAGGGNNGEANLHRLEQVFPEGKILFIIREQSAFIRSAYSTLVTIGYPHSIRRLAFPTDKARRDFSNLKKWGQSGFDYEHLRYDKIVSSYMDVYGGDNVLVLPFEMFIDQPESFIQKICSFASFPGDSDAFIEKLAFDDTVNESSGLLSLAIHSKVTRFLFTNLYNAAFINEPFNYWLKRSKSIRTVDSLIPGSINQWTEARVERYIKRVTKGHFRQSNDKISAIIGYDLSQYGYETSARSRPKMAQHGTAGNRA